MKRQLTMPTLATHQKVYLNSAISVVYAYDIQDVHTHTRFRSGLIDTMQISPKNLNYLFRPIDPIRYLG